MPKFKTRPIIVDAEQFQPRKIPVGVKKRQRTILSPAGERPLGGPEYWIDTPNGKIQVQVGDWIITDAKGRQYVSKPENFERIYEPLVEDVKGSEKKNEETKTTKKMAVETGVKGSPDKSS